MLIAQGVEVPADTPFRKYAEMVAKIVPRTTLAELKQALNNGTASSSFIGMEIADTWDGENAPLIVMSFGRGSVPATNDSRDGFYIARKYATTIQKQYNVAGNTDYSYSQVHSYLSGEYLEKCSEELKKYIGAVRVRYIKQGGGGNYLVTKCFIPSSTELNGTREGDGGWAWGYWANRMPVSTNEASDVRIVKNKNGVAVKCWTRTPANYPQPKGTVYVLGEQGQLDTTYPTYLAHILPVFAVLAD